MLSIRSLTRSLPRAARYVSSPCTRRTFSIAAQLPARPSWRFVSRPFAASFSTFTPKQEAEGTVNEELALKLASELNIENDNSLKTYPVDVKEYLDNTEFELHDTVGEDEVVLTRKFGDENIRVSFTIQDLNHMDQDQDDGMDDAMMDELENPSDARSKGSINQGSASNFKAAPEDSVSAADVEAAEELGDEEASFPAHVNVTIDRPGKGALLIEAIAQDGLFVIDNVSYYKDGELANAKSADQEFKTRDLYTGPPFGNLDEELQVLFEKYLDERGINVAMATFVPNYIDYKEQREYTNWLENIKNFVA